MNATQSDESNSEDSKDTSNEVSNYVAITASYESFHKSSEYATLDLHDSSEGESEEENDLQSAHNNLIVEFSKLKRLNKRFLRNSMRLNLKKKICLSNWMTLML